ncbi:maleylpyruvate isomerase family mycothiol-dependent enzyme [Streptomyces sp. NRRL B-24484]|uniref:maleylpyruvate isomerase family mycothiol-dependent enzyme n=1 Tax=Streptomyces sp. NRRL B-24484 TaxID=1463833 RepID=UPI0004BE8F76|nr:maleylpyruvate isomerase family mycothiol-dependent enzyme [Streptomyces sp. NRRL B-24484]
MAARSDVWDLVHTERRALLADVRGLTAEQWAVEPLCAGRTVRDTLAHMAATARITPPLFFLKTARAGFRFEVMAAREIAALTVGEPAATVAAFEAELDSVRHPPGPVDTWLGETAVHAEDIRRPLGITRAYPPRAPTRCADLYLRSDVLIGGRRRAAGLRLRAAGTAWIAGDGPEVVGPTLSLLPPVTGRPAGLAGLSGDGLPVLASRL